MTKVGVQQGNRAENWQQLAVDNLYLYAVFAISMEGVLETWNPGVKVVLGYDEKDFVGKSADIIFTPEDVKADIPEFEFRRAREQGNANDVRWHVRQDGSRFWATGAMTALRNEAGELTGYAKVVRDSSKSKMLEDNLEKLNTHLETQVDARTEELRQLVIQLTLAEQKERGRLAQTLHDSVQQELYAIQFALAKLEKQAREPAAVDSLEEIKALLRKTMQLTRNVTTDLGPALLEENNLGDSLQWLAHVMHERHGIRIKVVCDALCDIQNQAAHILLLKLVRELLFNSVKHAEVKEAVVTLSCGAEELSLVVEDEGKGFMPNLDASPSSSGLGLSGARKRLKLFGGTLMVVASPGKGTRITISMPLTTLKLG